MLLIIHSKQNKLANFFQETERRWGIYIKKFKFFFKNPYDEKSSKYIP